MSNGKRSKTHKQKSEDKTTTDGKKGKTGTCLPSLTSESHVSYGNNTIPESDILSVIETQVLRLVQVERASVHEVAETLNAAQQSSAWTPERVAQLLERARGKLTKAGELEAARPDAYVAADARARYDGIIRELRSELERVRLVPMLAGSCAKILKTIADVEKMRDDVLASLTGKSGSMSVGQLVYVSHLREGPVAGAARTDAARTARPAITSTLAAPGSGPGMTP